MNQEHWFNSIFLNELKLLYLECQKENINMISKLSKTDKILLVLALGTLIFSELMWFNGEKEGALFVGLWVPSILGFAIFLKLIKEKK